MSAIGRYAPSPTGAMHLGNARTALLAWLRTRSQGGRHLLRFEDLDTGRVRDWAYDCTRRDLDWLGLSWDEEFIQSERLDFYAQALSQLRSYPCTCTRKEVLAAAEESVGAPHGEELIYPATCRAGSVHPERPAALRWRVPDWTIEVQDAGTGARLSQYLPVDAGDFVLRRSDGAYAYHLAVVVDDALMQVTEVVRGADLWTATPRQVALQRALGYSTPAYYHVPLMTDHHGERLAKRGGAPTVRDLRLAGHKPQQVLGQLAQSLGWAAPPEVSALELLELYTAGQSRKHQ